MGVGYRVDTTFVSTPGINNVTGQEPFLEWIVAQQELGDNSAWVHSISYGDVEALVSKELADQLDVEFQKFGCTGRSFFVASGDNGSRCVKNATRFQPE